MLMTVSKHGRLLGYPELIHIEQCGLRNLRLTLKCICKLEPNPLLISLSDSSILKLKILGLYYRNTRLCVQKTYTKHLLQSCLS